MKSIFIGNMNSQTTADDLRTLFEPFGEIGRIHIVNDPETALPRRFAFLDMADDVEAAKAIAGLDGKELAGYPLQVNEATPRLERNWPRRRSESGPGAR
jgi:RNA recognition motif-containing protein